MRKYILIGIGGCFGAMLRYAIKNISVLNYRDIFPLSTIIINATGCFIFACILTIAFRLRRIDLDMKFGIATGFLGAFTTFSTLCKDMVQLMDNGYFGLALLYIALSVIVGLAAAYLGVILGELLRFKVRRLPEVYYKEVTIESLKDEGKK